MGEEGGGGGGGRRGGGGHSNLAFDLVTRRDLTQ